MNRLTDLLVWTSTRISPLPDIETVCAEPSPLRCHVPASLVNTRVWGITCQLASLSSERNLGIGDYADLSALCRVAANEGADFVGVNA